MQLVKGWREGRRPRIPWWVVALIVVGVVIFSVIIVFALLVLLAAFLMRRTFRAIFGPRASAALPGPDAERRNVRVRESEPASVIDASPSSGASTPPRGWTTP